MSSRISDLATEVKDVYMPKKDEDLPYIGLEHVEQGSLHLSSIGSSQEVESHKFRFKLGDILFGTLRPYFRKVIVAPCNGVCSTEFCVVRANDPEDQQFIFYGMAHPQFIKYATTNSKGARPRTKWKLFSDFEFPQFLPSQRRHIGNILSSYDDLIENNRRRIQLLEQAARLLYKEWFVHLRFPGHEHVEIIDGVPEGWKKSTFGDVVENLDRLRVPLSILERDNRPGPYPYHGAAGILGYIDDFLFEDRVLLIGEDGTVFTPFDTAMLQFVEGKLWVSNHAHVVKGKFVTTEFLYCFMSHYPIRPHITGVAQPKLSQKNLNRIEMLIPSTQVGSIFQDFVKPLIDQVFTLKTENEKLTKACDLLLPRLMNGEVVV